MKFKFWKLIGRYKQPDQVHRLSDEEREELARLIESPVFQKALIVAEQGRPHLFGNDAPEIYRAQRQGWEMHRTALLMQVNPPRPKRQGMPEPTYPRGAGE